MGGPVRLACTLVVLLAGCTDRSRPTRGDPGVRDPAKPNIVIFLTDTVRADRLGAYGCPRNTTPFFDSFAGRNFFFANAYAPSPWTRPSVASLFTGLNPQRHGVQMRQDVLPEELPTLAALLGASGWHTAIVNTNPHVTETWGMTRGFERNVHIMPHPDHLKAGNGAHTVSRHVRRLAQSLPEPYFLYVHLIDPHYPYEPPAEDLEALSLNPKGAGSRSRYDGELHYADRHIEEMMGVLDVAGLLDNTIVVMTSDHGEEFYEHGSTGHGKTLYQEVVRVPLALGMPAPLRRRLVAREGGVDAMRETCPRVEENVSLVDLMPTLLGLLGLRAPSGLDGIDLTPLIRCQAGSLRPLFFSVEKERASHAAVLVDAGKLIVDRATGARRLFLLDTDPKEQQAVPADRTEIRELKRRLRSLLESYESSVRPGYHLELASKDGERDRKRVRLRASTVGRFLQVEAHGFEPTDRMQLIDAGRTLVLDVRLASEWQRRPIHTWAQDRDEVTFEVEPRSSLISLAVEVDNKPAETSMVRFPPTIREDWPVTVSRRRAARKLGSALFDRRSEGLYVYVREARPKREIMTVSQEMEAALRALGYLQ